MSPFSPVSVPHNAITDYISDRSLHFQCFQCHVNFLSNHLFCVKMHIFSEYYKWNGLLAHKYINFKFPVRYVDFSLANAYSMNPSYPSNPADYQCKPTLYETKQDTLFFKYALQYTGYISVPETDTYKFMMFCNVICQFNVTKSGSNTVFGNYSMFFQPR